MSRTVNVPDWLSKSFLEKVLQQDRCGGKEVNVSKIDVTQAVPPGANYASDLFRVRCIYQEDDGCKEVKETSVIVKTLLTSNYIGKYFEESGITDKEYIAYTEFLPEVYKLLPKAELFTPKLLYSDSPKKLVLQDLKDQGFVMADRLKQLDFDHCLVCLKTVAKLHAAGVRIVQNKPEFIETLGKEPLFNKNNAFMEEQQRDFSKIIKLNFTKAVRKWNGFDDFEEKSRHLWETLNDDIYEVFKPSKDSLNVMNHGDLWTNNMMFKYDSDGNIVDFRLVDFQMCRYGTPVTDLLYFLFCSANEEVRENRLDELLSAYLETLNSVLEQLGCEERLTREQLDMEVKRCHHYIFYIIYSVLPVVICDPDDVVNMDDVTEESLKSADNNPFEKCYYGKYYINIAPKSLRYLYKVGFFDP